MAGACEYTLDDEDDEVFQPETISTNPNHASGDKGTMSRQNTIDRYGFIRTPGLPDPNM